MRVLVVDDHEDSGEMFAYALQQRGHEVTLVASVSDAIAAYDGGCCEVVVCDLQLPDGNGWDLMRTLRSRHQLSGIALSGLGHVADVERSRQAGFAAHLTKPVDVDALVDAVEALKPCA